MPQFDINTYDTVDSRLTRFWAEHPNGAVHSKVVESMSTSSQLIFQAEVWFDREDKIPAGVDVAYGEQDLNNTRSVDYKAWVENGSTSAIGRALAAAGYKAKIDSPRPSREEMVKSGAFERAEQPPPRTRSGPAPAQASVGAGERFPDKAPRGTKTADVTAFFKKHGFSGEGGVGGMIHELEQTYGIKIAGTAPDGGHYPSDAYNALAYLAAGDNVQEPADAEDEVVPF